MHGAPFRARFALSLAAMLSLTVASSASGASPDLVVEPSTILGSTTPEGGGWISVLVRLHNAGTTPIRGNVEVEARVPWMRGGEALATRLPFAVAPGATTKLEAPTRSYAGGESALRVRAYDAEGNLITETGLPPERPADAIVFHLSAPSRVAPALRGLPFASRRTPLYGAPGRTCAIGVSGTSVDATSGDLLVPGRAAGYSDATLVLSSVRALARLADVERAALSSWVLGGGALAVALDRPEDLQNPTLRALVGGEIQKTAPPTAITAAALFLVPPEEPEANPSSPTPLRSLRLSPSTEVERKLSGYTGGNLRATDWGASATYGVGEVHLLAFDPEDAATLSDPWTRYKLADLVRHAFDREPVSVVRQSARSPDALIVDGVRRELDPNQGTRWTIIVSALVLLGYAVLAGPVGFYLAARRGRPLRALFQLPLWSAATLGIVVLLGVIGKGISGRARRLAVVETGAGMTTGAAVFFRGFYTASSGELVVRAARREHVLDVAGIANDIPRTLTVDREGPRLMGLRTRPWETLLVREDGLFDLSGGITLLPSGNDLLIRNRAARDLIGVVVKPAGGDPRYFARIRDGETVLASKGRVLPAFGMPAGPMSSAVPLGSDAFSHSIDVDHPGLGKVWRAVDPALGPSAEWWPPDVPILIGALDGGQGKLTDSGLNVDYDRLLVRVVGTGGVP